jgi:hypothetical protein
MAGGDRVGKNEAIFREVNERIEEVSGSFLRLEGDWVAGEEPTVDFVCECGRVDCTDQVTMTLEAYEAVRAHPTRFLVVAGHEASKFERVVEQTPDYFVVEKFGEAARVAEEQDPRR